jgi:flagellar basal-body rod protein FlgB
MTMKIGLFDRSRIPLLEKQMDAFALRNKTISSNIANIGTPNYRRLDVSFEKELADAISEADGSVDLSNKLNQVQPEVEADPTNLNGSNEINIDQEMADLAKNQLQFSLVSKLTAATFQMIDKSINGDGQ